MRNGHEVQAHILVKVEEDSEFRERLASDPKGVIEAETGLGFARRRTGLRPQRR